MKIINCRVVPAESVRSGVGKLSKHIDWIEYDGGKHYLAIGRTSPWDRHIQIRVPKESHIQAAITAHSLQERKKAAIDATVAEVEHLLKLRKPISDRLEEITGVRSDGDVEIWLETFGKEANDAKQ